MHWSLKPLARVAMGQLVKSTRGSAARAQHGMPKASIADSSKAEAGKLLLLYRPIVTVATMAGRAVPGWFYTFALNTNLQVLQLLFL